MVESWACNWKNVGLIMAGSVVSMNLEQLKYGGAEHGRAKPPMMLVWSNMAVRKVRAK